jgi:hypothetical protein
MTKPMIKRKSIALVLTGAYALFSILAIRSAAHVSAGKVYAAMPIVTTIAYAFCIYFFIEIQRGKSNIFEKMMAWTSAGVFVARLIPLLHVVFPGFPPRVVAASYVAAALIVIATIALILRTVQLFNRPETVGE